MDEDGDNSMSIEDMKNRNPKMKKLLEKRNKRARVESGSEDEKDDPTGLFGSDSSDDEQESKPSGADKDDDDKATDAPPAEEVAEREAEKNELFGSSSDEE